MGLKQMGIFAGISKPTPANGAWNNYPSRRNNRPNERASEKKRIYHSKPFAHWIFYENELYEDRMDSKLLILPLGKRRSGRESSWKEDLCCHTPRKFARTRSLAACSCAGL